jgi:hypothetical protein
MNIDLDENYINKVTSKDLYLAEIYSMTNIQLNERVAKLNIDLAGIKIQIAQANDKMARDIQIDLRWLSRTRLARKHKCQEILQTNSEINRRKKLEPSIITFRDIAKQYLPIEMYDLLSALYRESQDLK